ncbi:FG-GAP repeat domain-containing protein [Maribacter sp. MAR_2009_72]|uniref:FG-GAP repeat domain-containing protein n=1 Tax=Maribacter sp. MAR_2009_72 TaxID=1250050 RepID=UPI00119B0293|nr:VCBS repeat-containing protein [Maribacter sp. MAR_2009_72]TVZ14245.1 VCBS repeat protein [Maribacter sp. MAR_2009_72]
MILKKTLFFLFFAALFSCNTENKPKEVVLYENYCASCHMAPDIQDLPKHIWEDNVLPAMAARMGIITQENHPYYKLPFNEQSAIIKTGIYPYQPIIDLKDWELLKNYIIELAPENLPSRSDTIHSIPLTQFNEQPVTLDSVKGSYLTFLEVDTLRKQIVTGSRFGELMTYDLSTHTAQNVGYFDKAITTARFVGDSIYVTNMGVMDPNEIPRGSTVLRHGQATAILQDSLHRPVQTIYADLDDNGTEEILLCEFGDLTGNLSVLVKDKYGFYSKNILLNLPGALRVVVRDMDKDGKDDLVVLMAQGDEAMYIFYQQEALQFKAKKIIRFSPVYGSSWFELVDFNGDGFDDIITVNGDNADKSFVSKPYHGMRIHINDGKNNFKEHYFHPLNGATRVIAKDFDEDGDIDMALLATFPDYENYPDYNFVYLENMNGKSIAFKQQHLANIALGRWFLMDAADTDADGDIDIVLSAMSFGFTPATETLNKVWKESYTDLLILENKLH